MSWELEQMYLDRRTGRVKESALRKEAVDLPPPILSFSEIKEQFGTAGTYKTTVQGIPVKIDVGYAYNHLSPNNNTHFEDRTRISGALYETLHNPFLIVKTQKGFTFYKPFRDGDKTLHLTSLHIDEKGKAKYKTFYEVNNLKKILEIIKTPERNVKFFSHSSRNQKKETSKPSDAPDSSPVPVGNPNDKKIIHKQAEFVNDIQQNTQIKKGNNMAANSNSTSSKKTYADHVSEKIIEAIEAGTAPWMRKWKGSELYGRSPYNGASDKPYKGINAVNLMITANALGYSDPRWLTYKQAKSIDAQVKKGERGTVIQYWKFEERRDVVDDKGKPVLDENGKPKKETVKLENPKVYFSTVFNAEQIENMPELKLENPLDFKPNETAENVLRNSGAEIEHKAGMSAYYMPGADKIVLPEKEQFVDEAGYYATALHELGHWTGHESRLDRDLSGNFGSESYAKEELRAEIGSYMLSSKLGIDFDPGNHFSYVDSWLKSLKEDKHEIFRAARDAEAISDYVMEFSLEKNVHKEKVEEEGIAMTKEIGIVQSKEPGEVQHTQSLDKIAILDKQTYLFVPYSEKDDAKAAGAKRDKENKAWYAEKGTPSKPLEKWALENVKFDTLNLQTTGDYMKDFVAELNARGFEVDHLETDGRIRNVKVEGNKGAEKSGAYAVHTDGRPVLWYKNHRTHETGSITHRESSFEAGADKKEIKKYEELNRIRILQRDKDTERMHNEVSSRLQSEYQKLPSVQSHPYLKEKGIDQADKAIKIDKKGSLLIPFVNANGEIKTVQRIPQQPQEGKFPKYWEKGGEKSGNFALLGADKISEVKEFVLCEGYATGETLHKALDMPVVVAGDSGNLSRVALKIIDANPDVKYKVTIAADNDVHITKPIENPGLTKAKETENEIKVRVEKVTLLKPTFSKADREEIKNPSDFNDLHKLKGIDAVKSQIAAQRYARQRAEDIQKEKAHPNQTRSREPKKETAREMSR